MVVLIVVLGIVAETANFAIMHVDRMQRLRTRCFGVEYMDSIAALFCKGEEGATGARRADENAA